MYLDFIFSKNTESCNNNQKTGKQNFEPPQIHTSEYE